MANFEGYLVASVNNSGNVIAPFPSEYMAFESYTSAPNQREEIKAYRDDNTRELFRITAEGMKSKIEFKTVKTLHLRDKQAIQSWISGATVDVHQRKVHIKFWDDENNQYKTGYFYIPNMNFPIKRITENDIIYGEIDITFIEY